MALLVLEAAPCGRCSSTWDRAGFVWYGGLAGGALATLWPIRRYGVAWASAADTAALGLALGYAFGKIGYHLAGDGDWGTPTTLPWGVAYPLGIARWPHPPGVRVHPAPLYETALSLAIFAVLWRQRRRAAPPGALFSRYLVLAGAARFLVEFGRTNRAVLLGLTEAQWTSLALIAVGATWLGRARPRAGHRRRPHDAPPRQPRRDRGSAGSAKNQSSAAD